MLQKHPPANIAVSRFADAFGGAAVPSPTRMTRGESIEAGILLEFAAVACAVVADVAAVSALSCEGVHAARASSAAMNGARREDMKDLDTR
jgi:hypothetical protein